MGQVQTAWCGEAQPLSTDLADWAASQPIHPRGRSRASAAEDELEADRLLSECPRELASMLRDTRQWDALRCRPWLSAGAFRGLQRSLQRCQLQKLMERYREAESPEECTFALPPVIPWADLDADHVISAGQIFRAEDASHSKLWQLRRLGLTVLRQGRVGVVLLAGGANLRLGGGEPPVGCSTRILQLLSGKSILQLCCERIRRIASLCRGPEDHREARTHAPRPSIPVFVMTSKLTHRMVVDHFESNRFFGLPVRDVFFFEQPMSPVLGINGRLLPQSLGGEFANAPGGTGAMLGALANSSALEQMRDRGVECLHVVGTENILARVCDPVFVGFCRELDVDCACKITERQDPYEDLDLFCIRQSPVSTQYADIEEAACGLSSTEAPPEVLEERNGPGLSYSGCINSFFFAVSYIEEVVGRPVRAHRLMRVLPYLDFHTSQPLEEAPQPEDPAAVAITESEPMPEPPVAPVAKKSSPSAGVALGTWPAETPSTDLACQRALLAAAAEVRSICRPSPGDSEEAWRCEVHLDGTGPLAVVRVRSAARGTLQLPNSIAPRDNGVGFLDGASNYEQVVADELLKLPLRCNLVVPSKTNAFVLEVSLLDYFVYTDRAVAFEVRREREFAAVREGTGPQSPETARVALAMLHRSWMMNAGAKATNFPDPNAVVEVSPLLSYEGEGLGHKGVTISPPCHLLGADEVEKKATEDPDADDSCNVEPDATMDGLDTRLFYLQEYPQRMQLSASHAPQFRTNSRGSEAPASASQKRTQSARAMGPAPAAQGGGMGMQLPVLWEPGSTGYRMLQTPALASPQSLLSWRVPATG